MRYPQGTTKVLTLSLALMPSPLLDQLTCQSCSGVSDLKIQLLMRRSAGPSQRPQPQADCEMSFHQSYPREEGGKKPGKRRKSRSQLGDGCS